MATQVRVRGTSSWFEQTITSRKHEISADEPEEFGGTDHGPTPYELLLSALGSCMAITVRMYAKKKGWNLEDVQVELEHHRIHAADCEECEQQTGYIDVIEKSIKFIGDLSDERKSRLLDIASRCPVHKTLQNSITIR
ncbi:MAG: OsmC family protein [Planctomycetota bacterium]